MFSRNRLSPSAPAKRSTRSVLLSFAALLAVATTLGGCIVEPGYHDHGGWWWHHHD
jgi:hypothetical protein